MNKYSECNSLYIQKQSHAQWANSEECVNQDKS